MNTILSSTTIDKKRSLGEYAIARLSRVCSVALPAVIFSLFAGWYLSTVFTDPVENFSNYQPVSLWAAVSSLFFLNESWVNPAMLTLNGPYWSLCYEVWYYFLFAVAYFTNGALRWGFLLLGGLIAGPAILILFPIWGLGVFLTKRKGDFFPRAKLPFAWLIFFSPLMLVIMIHSLSIDFFIKDILHESVPGFWRLEVSQRFVTDYLIGISVCLNLAIFSRLGHKIHAFFLSWGALFSKLAGFTFTLYLFHRPMTQYLGHYFPNEDSIGFSLVVLVGIIAICWVISFGTEMQLWR